MIQVVSPSDMALYREWFGTPEMRDVFCEDARMASWLRFEAGLAQAQAELGLIPQPAATEIARVVAAGSVSSSRIAELYRTVKLDTVAMIRALAEQCTPETAKYVHWGSTTTDILDTGLALQLKTAHALVVRDLQALRASVADLAERHRTTITVARTHSQHALPITFGFKLAIWVDDLGNHLQRLAEIRPRVLVGKVTGVVGSQAAYGEHGLVLQRRVCEILGLEEPDTSIQTSRARFQEFMFVLTLIANTLQQIGKEVWTRQRPELEELRESFAEGEQVGSTTLAFKRNPTRCEWLLGYSKILRGHLSSVMEIVMEDERDGARIAGEYALIPDSCLIVGCALRVAREVVMGLEVNVERMRANIDITHGFVYSEAVMMALAGAGLGKQAAHEVLYECANRCYREGIPLKQALREHDIAREYAGRIDLDAIMRPESYLGTIPTQIEAALVRARISGDAGRPATQVGTP